MSYFIPRHIKISGLDKRFKQLPHYQNVVAVLKDNYSKRDFFINEATKLFIEKFKTAKDFVTVNKEIATEANVSEHDIKRYTEPFFNHLKKLGFIIKEGSSIPV